MPNWCYTNYAIEGDKKSLDKIRKALKEHDIKEGSDETWEGNVLIALDIDPKKYEYMRGFINDYEDVEENVLKFSAEEA